MDVPETPQDGTEVVTASHMYLLMKQDYRISRNIRASWFFQHLSSVINFTPRDEFIPSDEELVILSVKASDNRQLITGTPYQVQILPNTRLVFIARKYRIVFALDFSPSLASVDVTDGFVLVDDIFEKLKKCLYGVIKPMIIPGSQIVMSPEIYVTVLALTPVNSCKFNQVLTQGVCVSQQNVEIFLKELKIKMDDFEQEAAQSFSRVVAQDSELLPSGSSDHNGEETIDPNDGGLCNPASYFVNMLRYGLLALQLLPENSSAGLVIITDGMVGLPDANVFESLMAQLRNRTVACSFIRVGNSVNNSDKFGRVPHTELMQFISTATFGAYFSHCPSVDSSKPAEFNAYHRALFFWSFQKGVEGVHITSEKGKLDAHEIALNKLLSHPVYPDVGCVVPTMRKKHHESSLDTHISNVLSIRLREGYTIKNVSINRNKGSPQIEMRLVLPWRDYVRIEYTATSAWPLDDSNLRTEVEIIIAGSYDFLHDITCTQINNRSPYRAINVKKFYQALQGLIQTDQMLVHLQSVDTNPVYYVVPDIIKKGIALFSMPQSSKTPELFSQANLKDSNLMQFAAFWKPVIMLDTNIWQKWMHTHRIGLVLEHDVPPPKYLHIPNSSGRFSLIISCRQSLKTLNQLLREWSDFVLMENHSYIKLMYHDGESIPSSFYLLRVTSKPPCMVLRLAFLGGTSGRERHQIVQELSEKVRGLKYPKMGAAKTEGKKIFQTNELKEVVRKPPLQRNKSEVNCCVFLRKPVEKILIRYERKPRDMTVIEDPLKEIASQTSSYMSPFNKQAASMFNTLSKYLHHQRWIWSVQNGASINQQATGRILSTLAKIRLQEGFHYASTNSGVVNMILEVQMKEPELNGCEENIVPSHDLQSCVVQYILFPPHNKTSRNSLSEDDLEEETTEADGELQIVTECWVEPQYGVVTNSTPERIHFDNLLYPELPSAINSVDHECVSCLITFERLVYLCQNSSALPLPNLSQSSSISRPSTPLSKSHVDGTPAREAFFEHTQCPFDLLLLLPRSVQAELQFSTFSPGQGANVLNLSNHAAQLESQFLSSSLYSTESAPPKSITPVLNQSGLKKHFRERSTKSVPK